MEGPLAIVPALMANRSGASSFGGSGPAGAAAVGAVARAGRTASLERSAGRALVGAGAAAAPGVAGASAGRSARSTATGSGSRPTDGRVETSTPPTVAATAAWTTAEASNAPPPLGSQAAPPRALSDFRRVGITTPDW